MHDAPAPTRQRDEARLISWASALISVGAMVIWSSGLTTPWDRVGVPVMATIYGLVAIGLCWRPAWLTSFLYFAIIPSSLYFLVSVYRAGTNLTPTGLYALACTAQFTPVFYIATFVALGRRANLVSWLHYFGLVGLYLYAYGPSLHGAENMSAHTWAVMLAGQPPCIVALYYISTLKGRLRATEKAGHESKERFLAMLSHEIRSPLQAMLGSIDLLALKAHSPPERRAIDRIRLAASQLDTHLRDVTEYTRLENPAWRLKPEATDLALLVRDVCEHFQPQAQNLQLTLACELPPADSLCLHNIWTDGARVRQILGNLIGNALKYTPSGRITVKAGVAPEAGHVQIEVIDTGIGIPPEQQERVFEPYVRLEDARVASAEGSGLGLAIVKRLADRMGAQISLISQPGQGSRFTVILPAQG